MRLISSKSWFYVLIGLVDIAVGVMFYVVNIRLEPSLADYNMPTFVQQVPGASRGYTAITGIPSRIVISSLAIDLNVKVGSYDATSGSWTIGAWNAYYADPSLPVNDSNGQTLIYGHAQPQAFGRLPEIQPGAEALVYTGNGYIFHYRYKSMQAVTPNDSTVFTANGPPTLVLQTCSGNWDAYRSLFSFKFESEEKV